MLNGNIFSSQETKCWLYANKMHEYVLSNLTSSKDERNLWKFVELKGKVETQIRSLGRPFQKIMLGTIN